MPKINYAKLYTLRADGRYQGYYRDADGKRHAVYDRDPETLYFKIQERQRPTAVTFRVLADGWERSERDKYEDGTWAAYEAPLRRAVERFGDRLADSITTAEIYQHMVQLVAEGYAARTVKLQRSIYRLIYKWAANDERYTATVTVNPAAMAAMPKGAKKAVKRSAPPDETVDRIRAGYATAQHGMIAAIYLNTGLRRGEALALQWRDVDFEKRIIQCSNNVVYRGGKTIIKAPKTEAGTRWVPLLPELETILKPLRGEPDEYILHGEDTTKPMYDKAYRRHWIEYCRSMGFVTVETVPYTTPVRGIRRTKTVYKPTLTAHVLRHGYATMLFEAGVDVYTAKKLLGHSDIQTTQQVYTHLRDRQQQKSIDRLIAHITAEA